MMVATHSQSTLPRATLRNRLKILLSMFVFAVTADTIHTYGAWRIRRYPHGHWSVYVLPTLLPFLCLAPVALWSAVYDRSWRISLIIALLVLIAAILAVEISHAFAFAGLGWYL